MTGTENFVYDSEGNLTDDKSKGLKISYDWRGMPVEFRLEPTGSSSDTLFKLTMAYDGSGRRISKTSMRKVAGAADWDTTQVTHYTGIGTEIRENYAGPAKETKVVVNMPNGLGRYGIEDAGSTDNGSGAGNIPNAKFEWYLKNHLGSTMLVYGTQSDANSAHVDIGMPLAAYDYRAFGEMLELLPPPTGKVTENFTGKEHDDEIALDYFGARYLDPMLGMWTSVDPARQFASPYLYAGNGYNPINVVDPDGNAAIVDKNGNNINVLVPVIFSGEAATPDNIVKVQSLVSSRLSGKYGQYNVSVTVLSLPDGFNDGDVSGINQVVLLNKGSPNCTYNESCVVATTIDDNYKKLFRESHYWDRKQAVAYIDISDDERNSYVVPHEFAHLLGLEDKYDKGFYKGCSQNLMCGRNGKNLNPSQIEEMWTPNTRNGYMGNTINENK